MKPKQELYYRLDPKDLIIEVGGPWDDFAKRNNGFRILAGQIEGQNLFSHITGDSTQMLMDVLLAKVRRHQNPVTHPYRCDSPTLKRFMEMTIEPDTYGFLNLRHRLLKSEPIASWAVVDAVVPGRTGQSIVIRCSMCNSVRMGKEWVELETATQQGLTIEQGVMRVAYGVCSNCRSTYTSEG